MSAQRHPPPYQVLDGTGVTLVSGGKAAKFREEGTKGKSGVGGRKAETGGGGRGGGRDPATGLIPPENGKGAQVSGDVCAWAGGREPRLAGPNRSLRR